jgi:hypothetical protein
MSAAGEEKYSSPRSSACPAAGFPCGLLLDPVELVGVRAWFRGADYPDHYPEGPFSRPGLAC